MSHGARMNWRNPSPAPSLEVMAALSALRLVRPRHPVASRAIPGKAIISAACRASCGGRLMREETVSEERVRLTDIDTRRLQSLIEGFRPVDLRDAASLALLERHVEQAEVLPARRIDPDVVTMDSEVLVRDLDTHEAIAFRVVFPRMADAAARRISVLAPLGMAVLGRRWATTSPGRRRGAPGGCVWIASSTSRSGRARTSHDACARLTQGGSHEGQGSDEDAGHDGGS